MKIRIIAWTDRGEIDVTREWEDRTTEAFGFGAVTVEGAPPLRHALDMVADQVSSAYKGGES